MHKVIDHVEKKINIPILHIADATAIQIEKSNINSVGLLGTKYTMEQDFYKSRIKSKGIKVLVPNDTEREVVNKVIYEELCLGNIQQSLRDCYKKVKQEDSEVPLFDTTAIHAIESVNKALEN